MLDSYMLEFCRQCINLVVFYTGGDKNYWFLDHFLAWILIVELPSGFGRVTSRMGIHKAVVPVIENWQESILSCCFWAYFWPVFPFYIPLKQQKPKSVALRW